MTQKIFGIVEKNEEVYETSLFDEIEIKCVEKKKVQIIINGEYSKGIPNNEENVIFQSIEKFFETHHRNIGLEIYITKNIPLYSGLQEEKQMIEYVLEFLHKHYGEKYNSKYSKIKNNRENNIKNIEIILLPEYKITETWLQEIQNYINVENKETALFNYSPKRTQEENIIFSYYPDIYEKYKELLKHNKSVGIVGKGSALYVLKN